MAAAAAAAALDLLGTLYHTLLDKLNILLYVHTQGPAREGNIHTRTHGETTDAMAAITRKVALALIGPADYQPIHLRRRGRVYSVYKAHVRIVSIISGHLPRCDDVVWRNGTRCDATKQCNEFRVNAMRRTMQKGADG